MNRHFLGESINGQSGIDLVTPFDPSDFRSDCGEVKDFDPLDYMERKEARRMDRFVQFAVAAQRMAMQDAALDMEKEDPNRVGVYIGSGIGGLATWEEQHQSC